MSLKSRIETIEKIHGPRRFEVVPLFSDDPQGPEGERAALVRKGLPADFGSHPNEMVVFIWHSSAKPS